MEVTEQDALAHIALQKGSRKEATSIGIVGGEGGHRQGIQRLWALPVDGDLLPIPGTGEIGGGQRLSVVG